MDTATKTGIDAAKNASKRVAQKSVQVIGKSKESRRNLHSTRKDNKLLMTLNCFEHKM